MPKQSYVKIFGSQLGLHLRVNVSMGVSILQIILPLLSYECVCLFPLRTHSVHILSLSSFGPSFLPKSSFICSYVYYRSTKEGVMNSPWEVGEVTMLEIHQEGQRRVGLGKRGRVWYAEC